MMIERIHDIRCREFLAVMKGHALANLERDLRVVRIDVPALGEGRVGLQGRIEIDQTVVYGVDDVLAADPVTVRVRQIAQVADA